ncbi:hypothetical protein [Candidatus Borrarchaeum sp.]|uniref:hypothetical protein n=1 Tax=Candidatus Borrarchaeum sp. TaxID=2846742 RepID=UPI00257B0241|nr:hypothetical protein [Candidatus Borrarchaeum sp.]
MSKIIRVFLKRIDRIVQTFCLKRRELHTILFIITVNFLYFLIVFLSYFLILDGRWAFYGNPLAWLAEWIDYNTILRKAVSNQFTSLRFPILGSLYLYLVGRAALISSTLVSSVLLRPIFYLYMGLFNVLFEIITVILTMRLVSRYFGQIYASNITFIFILLPIVWWTTICRWDLLPLALTVCTIYFAVENKAWYAWSSLTIAVLAKLYPIIFAIPLLFYYFEKNGAKKTLIYVSSMIIVTVLIYIPFYLIYGWNIFNGVSQNIIVNASRSSIWYWISILCGEKEKALLFSVSGYIQAAVIFSYVLLDYFHERNQENPLTVDKALLKRCSIVILLFLVTFKFSKPQGIMYGLPLVIFFSNSFKKFFYFLIWLITLHVVAYPRIMIYAYLRVKPSLTIYILIGIAFLTLYTAVVALILFNKNLFENDIQILSERDFIIELHNYVKKIKKFLMK